MREAIEKRSYSNGYCWKASSQKLLHCKLLMSGIVSGADIGKELANLNSSAHKTNANSYAYIIAVRMLFRIQGFQQDRINGFALKKIMKKLITATRKKQREDLKYKIDIHLKRIQERVDFKRKLYELEHLGCKISSVMAFPTLQLAEIYRASVIQLEDNVWQLSTSI
ncbi:MAG: hypothetical protein EZS28_030065 [Streblomastix strix]|uniref:Uncharacterized protein n=1 Tax=Streblomastix strix TaxID=222440 RepID=A0A5J4UVD6_9EUKA|nr:MAG: hypothetical protein EZS28_030065 [Streblomastix strix]